MIALTSPMPPSKLGEALRQLHADAMIGQAEFIGSWPDENERNEEAMNHVRLALWEQEMGRITELIKYRIYSTLSFVMPVDDAFQEGPTSLETLEREAEWELAYHAQLDRRGCSECGDGICPEEGSGPIIPGP